jgi:hypothetical protein
VVVNTDLLSPVTWRASASHAVSARSVHDDVVLIDERQIGSHRADTPRRLVPQAQPYADGLTSSSAERALIPGDIAIRAMLEAAFAEGADMHEAMLFVERHGCLVRQGNAGVRAVETARYRAG